MWDFMQKKPPRIPACHVPPTAELKKELANYKRLIIDEINATYEKICENLSVTDSESLATLHDAITEYKEVIAAIDQKIETISELNNDALKDLGGEILYRYDSARESLDIELYLGFGQG